MFPRPCISSPPWTSPKRPPPLTTRRTRRSSPAARRAMAGYLDQYGAGEERRIRIIKTLVFSAVGLVILGAVAFFVFHNYRQEQQVKRFFELLEARNYQGAYDLWVRTES